MTDRPNSKESDKKQVGLQIETSEKNDKNQSEQKQNLALCYFCHKVAEFRCGNCEQATYCSPEHQRADWPSHKKKCIKPEYRLKEMKKQGINLRKNFFDKLCRGLFSECEVIINELVNLNKQMVTRFPLKDHQIEYGSSVFSYAKFQISIKNFNEAQELLNNYMKDHGAFIRDTSQFPQKLDPDDPNYENQKAFVEGKLKLISVLCSLTHQVVRNAVSIIEILLEHVKKFYGPDSLEVSNLYFEFANYFNFLNQPNKAIACFLIASRIRKQKRISCLYNIAILFLRQNKYHNAIRFFYDAIEIIQKQGDHHKILHTVYLGLGYCFKKLNHFDLTVQNFQKALCQFNNKKSLEDRQVQSKLVREILKKLSIIYKKQFQNDLAVSLPKEVNQLEKQKPIVVNENLQRLWEMQKDNSQRKKRDEWIKSFKLQEDKTKFTSKIPMTNNLVEKVLFKNHFIDDKRDDNQPVDNINYEIVKMDLNFMSDLTSLQVRYMHDLNRMLIDIKDKEVMYEIVENSNLMQMLSNRKKERFFEINSKLKRPHEEDIQYMINKNNKIKPGDQALKLNLEGLPKVQ